MTCLHSDPQIGVVGPVTNYIGGDQQIEVPYREVEDMWSFAANQNRPDPETSSDGSARWILLAVFQRAV